MRQIGPGPRRAILRAFLRGTFNQKGFENAINVVMAGVVRRTPSCIYWLLRMLRSDPTLDDFEELRARFQCFAI